MTLDQLRDKGGKGFLIKETNRIALTRCPACHEENYAMNVLAGFCSWCGFDANEDMD